MLPETMVVEPPESVVAPVTSPARLTKPPCTPRLVIAAVVPMASGLPAELLKMPLASTVALAMTRFVSPLAPVTPLVMRQAADRAARGRDGAAGERRRADHGAAEGHAAGRVVARPSCRSRRRWPPGCRRRKPRWRWSLCRRSGVKLPPLRVRSCQSAAGLVQVAARQVGGARRCRRSRSSCRRKGWRCACSGCRPRWPRRKATLSEPTVPPLRFNVSNDVTVVAFRVPFTSSRPTSIGHVRDVGRSPRADGADGRVVVRSRCPTSRR